MNDYQLMYECNSCKAPLNKDEVYKVGTGDDQLTFCEDCIAELEQQSYWPVDRGA